MVRRFCFLILGLLFLMLLFTGCTKKIVRVPSIEAPSAGDPIVRLLEAFSPVESIQAKASIRVDTVRMGEEMNFLLNGFVLYKRPDKLRILGYLPFGTGLFDAVYRNGEFFLLSPLQKRAYVGEISELHDQIEKAGIRISTEKAEGSEIPSRIVIEAIEKQTRVELKLKEISVNSSLAEDSFDWAVPRRGRGSTPCQTLEGKKFEMRIAFVIPRWPKKSFWDVIAFKFPLLSTSLLAGLTPSQHEVSLIDESLSEIDFDQEVDLVAITAITPLAPRAYEIADQFRSRGRKG